MAPPKTKQSTISGWISTKKRGRDDAEIARDMKKALSERRKRRTTTSVQAQRKKAQQAKTKKAYAAKKKWQAKVSKRRRKKIRGHESDSESEEEEDFVEEDSDEDSIDEFIVDDDQIDEESDESEDEAEVEFKPKQRKKPPVDNPAPKNSLRTITPQMSSDSSPIDVKGDGDGTTNESDSDSDSDANDGTKSFFANFKARPSKPSKALAQGSIAATNRVVKRQPRAKPQSTRMSTPPTLKAKRDRDRGGAFVAYSENLTSPEMNSPKVRKIQAIAGLADEDSDKSDIKTSKYFREGAATRPKAEDVTSKVSSGKPLKQAKAPMDSLSNLSVTSKARKPRLNNFLLDSSDEDEPTHGKVDQKRGVRPGKSAKTERSSVRMFIDDEDDDEEDEIFQEALRQSVKNSFGARGAIVFDSESEQDDDEAAAIKLAIKESKNDARRKAKKETKNHLENKVVAPKSTTKAEPKDSDDEKVVLLDESSEEEDAGSDAEYDDEKRAATSVLETAEQLSANVLKAMMEWQNDDNHSVPEASQGMIMDDGALTLFALKNQPSNSELSEVKKNAWITRKEIPLAEGIKLSDYQLIGVNWLALLHGMKCSIEGKRITNVCGVLADEMGLGKTAQTIAFLSWLKNRRNLSKLDENADESANPTTEPHRPHLVVVPVSVMDNWMREFKTFSPELSVVKYHGSQAERKEIQADLYQHLPPRRPRQPLDIILCPVTFFQKEKSPDKAFLSKFKFEYLVVDEAHMLKNANSIRYKMLNRISSSRRLLLTGTPVQNSPQELLNMLCFLMPLFSKSGSLFEEDANGNERMLQHFVDQKKEGADDEYAYRKLKQLFAPFVLRRKKEDVLSQILPPKVRKVEFVELDSYARSIYDGILAAHVDKTGTTVSAGIGDSLFTNLRKAAHHALLLRTRHTSKDELDHLITKFQQYGAFKGEGSTKERVAEELTRYNDFDIHLMALDLIEENPIRRKELQRYVLDEEDLFCSAKFTRLRQIIPPLINQGHRLLIFSAWTSCLDLLGCLMQNLDLDYLRMDGSSPAQERQKMIDQFNKSESIPVFLLSTKACGVGINLTAADTCIMHDLDFNPFNDLQAEDRCHRIGQKRPVTVIKLVAKDTVDSDIYHMQERKSKMNAAIMDSKTERKVKRDVLDASINRFKCKSAPEKDGSSSTCIL